ncbi:MAG: hypothetical protein EP348_00690, partial [Alphaproteobacteria bacterium]
MIRHLFLALGMAVALSACVTQSADQGQDLPPKTREAFAAYSTLGYRGDFKAFYYSPSRDLSGMSFGYNTVDKAVYIAGKFCAKQAPDCELYAVGDTVVKGGGYALVRDAKAEYKKRLQPAGETGLGTRLSRQEIEKEVPNQMLEGQLFGGLDFLAGFTPWRDAEIRFTDIPNRYRQQDKGHWRLDRDKVCLKFGFFFDAEETCFDLYKTEDVYQLVTEKREIYATFHLAGPYAQKTGLFFKKKEKQKPEYSFYTIGEYVGYSEICTQFRGTGADNLIIRDIKQEFEGDRDFERGYHRYASYSSYDSIGRMSSCDMVRK